MATITIEVNNDHVARVKAAYLNQFIDEGNSDPSNAEIIAKVKSDMLNAVKAKVFDYETGVAKVSAIAGISNIDVS